MLVFLSGAFCFQCKALSLTSPSVTTWAPTFPIFLAMALQSEPCTALDGSPHHLEDKPLPWLLWLPSALPKLSHSLMKSWPSFPALLRSHLLHGICPLCWFECPLPWRARRNRGKRQTDPSGLAGGRFNTRKHTYGYVSGTLRTSRSPHLPP